MEFHKCLLWQRLLTRRVDHIVLPNHSRHSNNLLWNTHGVLVQTLHIAAKIGPENMSFLVSPIVTQNTQDQHNQCWSWSFCVFDLMDIPHTVEQWIAKHYVPLVPITHLGVACHPSPQFKFDPFRLTMGQSSYIFLHLFLGSPMSTISNCSYTNFPHRGLNVSSLACVYVPVTSNLVATRFTGLPSESKYCSNVFGARDSCIIRLCIGVIGVPHGP